ARNPRRHPRRFAVHAGRLDRARTAAELRQRGRAGAGARAVRGLRRRARGYGHSGEDRTISRADDRQSGERRAGDVRVRSRAMTPYVPKDIEEKWQKRWAEARVAEVDVTAPGDKFYMLNMFPYPSGDLHVGHGRNYILGDALYRFFRMQGRVALNPMGWDAFGLPAENAAIKNRIHPREWTLSNIARMK